MASLPELAPVRNALERTFRDSSRSAVERKRDLTEARDDLSDLTGQAQRYRNQLEMREEGGAADGALERVEARERADVREAMLARGEATADDLDEMGFLSHEQLDALEQDGTLGDRLAELATVRRSMRMADGPDGRREEAVDA
jgi:hypothetical protein